MQHAQARKKANVGAVRHQGIGMGSEVCRTAGPGRVTAVRRGPRAREPRQRAADQGRDRPDGTAAEEAAALIWADCDWNQRMNESNDLRLIEDYLPIEAISKEASREKSVRKGHISTLHLWWARRPLVACRAAVYGALVPADRWVKDINVKN